MLTNTYTNFDPQDIVSISGLENVPDEVFGYISQDAYDDYEEDVLDVSNGDGAVCLMYDTALETWKNVCSGMRFEVCLFLVYKNVEGNNLVVMNSIGDPDAYDIFSGFCRAFNIEVQFVVDSIILNCDPSDPNFKECVYTGGEGKDNISLLKLLATYVR